MKYRFSYVAVSLVAGSCWHWWFCLMTLQELHTFYLSFYHSFIFFIKIFKLEYNCLIVCTFLLDKNVNLLDRNVNNVNSCMYTLVLSLPAPRPARCLDPGRALGCAASSFCVTRSCVHLSLSPPTLSFPLPPPVSHFAILNVLGFCLFVLVSHMILRESILR